MPKYPIVKMKAGKEANVTFGHPWVFSGALDDVPKDLEHGSLVHLADRRGEIIGTGTYSATSSIAVRVFDQTGYSYDVSATGILFEIDNLNEVGSEISFELELNTPNGKMKLKCMGNIVRREVKGQKTAIAVKITDSQLT